MTDKDSERLMQALGFTDADLKANRAGKMSDLQRKRFNQFFWAETLGYGLLALIFFGLLYIQTPPEYRDTNSILWIVRFALIILFLAGGWRIYRHNDDLATGFIISCSSCVKKLPRSSHDYFISITNYGSETEHLYSVGSRAYEAFLDEETYTLYMPSFWEKRILSAEHVPTKS